MTLAPEDGKLTLIEISQRYSLLSGRSRVTSFDVESGEGLIEVMVMVSSGRLVAINGTPERSVGTIF